jgi:hypothetical protein
MITEEIRQIAEKIKEALDPERIYLFGSYARNQENETSDYDFYVVVDEREEKPLVLSQQAYRAIREYRTPPCDIIVNSRLHFNERCKRQTLENTVVTEGVVMYER